MRNDSWKHLAIEGWVFVVIAVIAFVGGLVIGELGNSTKTEIVYVGSSEQGEAEGAEPSEPAGAEPGEGAAEPGEGGGTSGAQLFTSIGCASCHTLAAAGATGEVGPDLEESLATDDNTAGIEEMIIHPNAEVVEGYPANVMPQEYGQTLSAGEIHTLAEFLVASTPAKP